MSEDLSAFNRLELRASLVSNRNFLPHESSPIEHLFGRSVPNPKDRSEPCELPFFG